MTTREMLSDELVEAMENLHQYPRVIAERAAREAVAAERARITAAVKRAHPKHDDWWCECAARLPDSGDCPTAAFYLAIVNPEAEAEQP